MPGYFSTRKMPTACAWSREQKIAEVYHACCQSGHELLEVILPRQRTRAAMNFICVPSPASTTSVFT